MIIVIVITVVVIVVVVIRQHHHAVPVRISLRTRMFMSNMLVITPSMVPN